MKDVLTLLSAPSSAARRSSSCSLSGAIAFGPCSETMSLLILIEGGTHSAMKASSDSNPSVASILLTLAGCGPTWRRVKESSGAKSESAGTRCAPGDKLVSVASERDSDGRAPEKVGLSWGRPHAARAAAAAGRTSWADRRAREERRRTADSIGRER